MKKTAILLFLLVSLVLFAGLKLRTDTVARYQVPGSSIIYIPSGKSLKYVTFGYHSLMADLVYLWAIQYFSDQTIWERFDYLDHIFSIIAELDPQYLDPYEIGALIAVYDVKNLDLAFKILDRGIEKNPAQWIIPLQAGHVAQMFAKNFEVAQKYYKMAMAIEGAPAIARRLYANAAFRISDYKTAWQNWLEIYESATDPRVIKIASNHLYRTKAAMDFETLQSAIELYKNKHGRAPSDLQQLVSEGLIQAVPKDLDGEDYLYDPETEDIKTRISPWKR
jgi:tetratricopeptide (TPR) repeat protein